MRPRTAKPDNHKRHSSMLPEARREDIYQRATDLMTNQHRHPSLAAVIRDSLPLILIRNTEHSTIRLPSYSPPPYRQLWWIREDVFCRSLDMYLLVGLVVDHLPNRALFGQRITGLYSILTGGGQEWATKRRIMTTFFQKQNMSKLTPHFIPLMDRLLETKVKPMVKGGNVIDLHELSTIIFSALPGVVGLDCPMGVDEPEEIGKRVNILLDIIPAQLANPMKTFGEMASTKKRNTIQMVIEMRMMGRNMVHEKRKEMEGWEGQNPSDDLLAWLITANDAAGLSDEGSHDLTNFKKHGTVVSLPSYSPPPYRQLWWIREDVFCRSLDMYLLVGLVVIFLFYHVKDNTDKWLYAQRYRNIPGPPVVSFLQGHEPILFKAKQENTLLEQFITWVEEYGETFKFCITPRPVIFTVDPDALKQIFSNVENWTKVDHLPNRALFGQRITGLYSILTGGGQEWAIKRRIMTTFFHKQNMSSLTPNFITLMDRLLETKVKPMVKGGSVVDLHELSTIIFSALPGVVGFDCPMGVNEPEEIGKRVNILLDIIPTLEKVYVLDFCYGERESNLKRNTIQMVIEMRMMGRNMVHEKRKEMEGWEGQNPSDDLLAWLITANDAAGLSDEEVVDDILTVYLVMDNMSKQIGSIFIYLINHPEIYKKMETLTGQRSLAKLTYTEMVILESLRMTPVLLKGTRWMKNDAMVGGYHIPGDVQFQYSQYVLHRNKKFWPKPREFDPERFAYGVPGVDDMTFIPFLAGRARTDPFVHRYVSMKLMLSMMARNFDLTPQPTGTVPFVNQAMAVTRLKGGPFYYILGSRLLVYFPRTCKDIENRPEHDITYLYIAIGLQSEVI
eukprot:sb/3462059/